MAAFSPTDFRASKLRYSDYMRFPDYYLFIQQEISTSGASQFVAVDRDGRSIYRPPRIIDLQRRVDEQDGRYLNNSNATLGVAAAREEYANNANQWTWQALQQAQEAQRNIRYDAVVEDPRGRFMRDQLTAGLKEMSKMTVACTQVFKAIHATIDTHLSSKVQLIQSRSGNAPSINLLDAMAMLATEMEGNKTANREACLEQINKLRVAHTLPDLRLVLDVMQTCKNTVDASIRLYGGNGQLSDSQYHYKLLSKVDPKAPELTFIRMQLSNKEVTTPLEELRMLIKPELDRAVDPMRSLSRSSVSSTSRSGYHAQHVHVANLAGVVEDYNASTQKMEREEGRQEEGEGDRRDSDRWGRPSQGGYPQPQQYEANYGGQAGGPRQQASEGHRIPAVCSSWLHNKCDRGTSCRFEHPPHLAGAMLPNAPQRRMGGGLSAQASAGPPRASPSPGAKAADSSVGKKRPIGSPAPQKGAKIRVGKAYEASYTYDEGEEGEQQQQGDEYEQEEQEGDQEWT